MKSSQRFIESMALLSLDNCTDSQNKKQINCALECLRDKLENRISLGPQTDLQVRLKQLIPDDLSVTRQMMQTSEDRASKRKLIRDDS